MIPVVAIVGRPNVGKSTLFNRLTRTRNALVSDFAGMTRDRQYGEVNIADHHFIAIDTGGITDEDDEINKLTTEQSLLAIKEADKILFLVDGRSGVTNTDLLVAEKLRTLNKNVFLVVNKTEGLDPELVTAEFFRLGYGTPYAIAASHGEGVTDLIQTVFQDHVEPEPESEEETGIKLAIIGRPNVGKSTLTNRMLGEERVIVLDMPGTTRDSISIPMIRQGQKYTLIDTAGIRRRGKIFEATEKFSVVKTLQAIEATNVVLFLIDARDGVTDHDLRLLGYILEKGKALVVALNKWDGMSTEEREHANLTLERKLNFIPFVRIHYISALHGTGVGNLFASINEAYESSNRKLTTNELTNILLEAVIQHNPPLVEGRRIKLRYAHSGGHNPQRIIVHGNQVESLPDSYKRYLAGTYQARLKLKGSPVCIEVKRSENPFKNRKPVKDFKHEMKKRRLMRHVKR